MCTLFVPTLACRPFEASSLTFLVVEAAKCTSHRVVCTCVCTVLHWVMKRWLVGALNGVREVFHRLKCTTLQQLQLLEESENHLGCKGTEGSSVKHI